VRVVLRDPNVRWYLLAQALSLFGDTALWLAAAVWVKALTGSNAAAGLVFFAFTAAQLFGPLTGLLVDRVRRAPLLLLTNVATAAVVTVLLLVHDAGDVWLVYVVMLAYGLSNTVLTAGQTALLTVMVPAERLGSVNGAVQTVTQGIRLGGPLAGAALFTVLSPYVVVLVDIATFVVAAALLAMIRVVEPPPERGQRLGRGAVSAGARHLLGRTGLRQVVFAAVFAVTFFGFLESLLFAVVDTGLHRAPAFVSILATAQGIGGVVGGLLAARVMRTTTEGLTVGLGLLVFAVGMPVLTIGSLPAVLIGTVLVGVGLPWIVAGAVTLLQRATPVSLQGRAFAAMHVMLSVPQALSIALGAALVAAVDYRLLLATVGSAFAVSALFLLTRPEQRRPAAPPADAPDDRQRQPGSTDVGSTGARPAGSATSR
jgi:MFS family permease